MRDECEYVVVARSLDEGAKRIELPTNADNTLGLPTLKGAFPGAHGLEYINPTTGAFRGLLIDTDGTKFLPPPGGWAKKVFLVLSQQQQQPMETPPISQTEPTPTPPPYIPIEIGDFVHKLDKYLFYEKDADVKHCFTVISTHLAVTFNHGPHEKWSSEGENRTTVTLYNQAEEEFLTTVVMCSPKVDFVVVHSEKELVSEPPKIAFPRKLERYVLLGYPEVDREYQALEGIFSSVELDERGRMHGSSGSKLGYSGGPIFNYKGDLLGINVANLSQHRPFPFHGEMTLNDAFIQLAQNFPFLSVIAPAYYVTHLAYLHSLKQSTPDISNPQSV